VAQTVKIDPKTHALLRQLAEEDHVSMQEQLARAVKAMQRARFFHQMAQGYVQQSSDERAEDAAEMILWDQTLGDGVETE
jgi:hypothetical protein